MWCVKQHLNMRVVDAGDIARLVALTVTGFSAASKGASSRLVGGGNVAGAVHSVDTNTSIDAALKAPAAQTQHPRAADVELVRPSKRSKDDSPAVGSVRRAKKTRSHKLRCCRVVLENVIGMVG